MSELVVSIIMGILSMMATVFCVFLAVKINANQRKSDKRSEDRAKEGQLMLRMVHAVGQLTVGTALAVKSGKLNGELDEGLEALAACERDYIDFMERVAMSSLRK